MSPCPGTRIAFTTSAWNARNSVAANTSLDVDELEPEAQVGLVAPVAVHRLVPRQPLERRGAASPVAASIATATTSPIDVHHVVGVGEAHLHVELRELELPVGARVLVAQAACDLVVAIEPADHEQLLEELRALRQRVEAARGVAATGTTKSRAPSGVDAMSIGVSTSTKPAVVERGTREPGSPSARSRRLRCMRALRRSR